MEKIATLLINKILGRFIKGFNYQALKLSFSGSINLRHLELKDFLNFLDMPFALKYGVIDKIHLKIPWYSLYKEHSLIEISGLYILLESKRYSEFTIEQLRQRELYVKSRILSNLHDYLFSLKQEYKEDENDPFSGYLMTTILKSLQISIKDIHIRFEDHLSLKSHLVTSGIAIENIIAKSTDENFDEHSTNDSVNIYKQLTVQNIRIYSNFDDKKFDYDSIQTFIELMSSISTQNENNTYILESSTFKLNFAIFKDRSDKNAAKKLFNVIFNNFAFVINKKQFDYIMDFKRRVEQFRHLRIYRKFYPEGEMNAEKRWKYIIDCVMSGVKSNNIFNSKYFDERIKNKNEYCRLYKKLKQTGKLNKEEEDVMNDLELNLPINDLIYFRTLTEIKLKSESKKDKQGITGWLKSFVVSSESESSIEIESNDLQSIYDSIGYSQSSVNENILMEEITTTNIKIDFISPSLILQDLSMNRIGTLQFNNMRCNSEIKLNRSSHYMEIGTIKLFGHILDDTKDLIYPNIEESPLLTLRFDINPKSVNVDYLLDVHAKKLNIVFDTRYMKHFKDFFSSSQYIDPSFINYIPINIKSSIAKSLYLSLEMDAPTLIFPHNDISNDVILCSLGYICIKTNLNENNQTEFNDIYNLSMSSIEVFGQKKVLDKQEYQTQKSDIISKFDLNFELSIKKDDQKNQIGITGILPQLNIILSPNNMKLIRKSISYIFKQSRDHYRLVSNLEEQKIHEYIKQNEKQSILDARFVIQDLNIELLQDENTYCFSSVRIIGLGAHTHYLQNVFNMTFMMRQLNVYDHLSLEGMNGMIIKSNTELNPISSVKSLTDEDTFESPDNLISIFYRYSNDPTSNIKSFFDIKLNDLNINLKNQSIDIFIDFFQKIKTKDVEIVEENQVNVESRIETQNFDGSKFIIINSSSIKLTLINENPFADIEFKGSRCKIEYNRECSNVQGQLSDFKIFDVSGVSGLYTLISSGEGNKIVEFNYLHKYGNNGSDESNKSLDLTFSSLKSIVIHKFVNSALRFYNSMKFDHSPSPHVSHIQFHIIINNPIFIFPQNSTSSKCVYCNLGNIEIENDHSNDKKLINIRNLNIKTGELTFFLPTSILNNSYYLIQDSDIVFEICNNNSITTNKVRFDQLSISMTSSQLKLICFLFRENVFYTPTEEEVEMKRKHLMNIETEMTKNVSSKYFITIDNLELKFGFLDNNDKEMSNIKVLVDSVDINYVFYSNYKTNSEFKTSNMKITYSDELYNNYEFIKRKNDEGIQLQGSINVSEEGQNIMNIELDESNVYMIPKLLDTLYYDGYLLYIEVYNAFEKRSWIMRQIMNPQLQSMYDKNINLGAILNLNIKQSDYIFTEHLTQCNHKQFILSTGLNIIFNFHNISHTCKVSLFNLEGYSRNTTNNENLLIIAPLTASFNYVYYDKSITYTLELVNDVSLTLSITDVVLFRNIWNEWKRRIRKDYNNDVLSRENTIDPIDEDEIIDESIYEMKKIDKEENVIVNLNKEQLKTSEQKFLFHDCNIEIIILDDIKSYLPIIKSMFKTSAFSVKNWSDISHYNASIEAEIEADYFSFDNYSWVPLLEPFYFELSVNRKDYHIKSSVDFNINITYQFFKMLKNLSKIMSITDISQVFHNNTSSYINKCPYILINNTGSDVYYYFQDESKKILVNPNEKVVLYNNENPQISDSSFNRVVESNISANSSINLLIEGYFKETFAPSTVQSHLIHITNQKVVYMNVISDYKTKKIILTTGTVIKNSTNIQIECIMENDKDKVVKKIIEPHSEFSLPLSLENSGTISVRPFTEMKYAWSDHIKISEPIKNFTALQFDYSDFKAIKTILIRKTLCRLSNCYYMQNVIELLPLLVVENFLCCDIYYKLYDCNEKRKISEGKIEKFSRKHIYEIPRYQNVYISIRSDNFKWSEQTLIITKDNRKIVNRERIVLEDEHSQTVNVYIDNNIHRNGNRVLTLYTPYWIVNKTGLPIKFLNQENKEIYTLPGKIFKDCTFSTYGDLRDQYYQEWIDDQPSVFSPPKNSSQLIFRFPNTEWSPKLNLKSKDSMTYISLLSKKEDDNKMFEFSVSISSASQVLWKTKAIEITPRYILVNKLDQPIYLKQYDTLDIFSLLPNEQCPWHWPDSHMEKFLSVGIMGASFCWSGKFKLDTISVFPLRIYDNVARKVLIIRIEVKIHIKRGISLIKFMKEDEQFPLYMIDNGSNLTLYAKESDDGVNFEEIIPPRTRYVWAWNNQNSNQNISIKIHKEEYIFSFSQLHSYDPICIKTKRGTYLIQPILTTENSTRILSFKLINEINQIHKSIYIDSEYLIYNFKLNIKRIGISLFNHIPKELLYGRAENLMIDFSKSSNKWSLELLLDDLQVDNQDSTTFFPVFLHSKFKEPQYFLMLSIIRTNELKNIKHIPYFSISLRETSIKLDQNLVDSLLRFFDITIESIENKTPSFNTYNILKLGNNEENTSNMIYCDVFHLNPSKFNISFIRDKRNVESEKLANAILSIPTGNIPTIENSPINLHGLLIEHTFSSQSDLISRILTHYKQDIWRQTYAIFGSFEILGNPASLISNLGKGVYDLFYEPAKGGTISPKEFGKGLKKGGESFVRRTFFAIFNSTSSVVKGVGSGVSYASLDDEYRKSRIESKRRNRPNDVKEGLEIGFKEFGNGIIDGITGIVGKPIEGYDSKGVSGMFEGFAKGLLGVVVKPTVGAIDLVQRTTEGIKNTTKVNEEPERNRLPRYIGLDGKITNYDIKYAKIQSLLHTIDDFKYADNDLWDFIPYPISKTSDQQGYILISSSYIIYTRSNTSSIWSIPWDKVTNIQYKKFPQTCIEIVCKQTQYPSRKIIDNDYQLNLLKDILNERWNLFKLKKEYKNATERLI